MIKTAALVAALALLATVPMQGIAYAKPGLSGATSQLELTAGKKKSKKGKVAKKAKKSKSAKRGAKKPTHVASAKSCGTYMYRKDGKCVDARAKK